MDTAVIARTVSCASQSDAGAQTREILMAALPTLKKRQVDVVTPLKAVLDPRATTHAFPNGPT
jgi:hypothetical protein